MQTAAAFTVRPTIRQEHSAFKLRRLIFDGSSVQFIRVKRTRPFGLVVRPVTDPVFIYSWQNMRRDNSMSVEDLKEYARRCASDPDLRAKAKEIGATDLDGQIAHAASMGLTWTKEDMAAFQEELQADGELGEDDLEKVAGGVVTTTAAAAAAVVGAAAAVVGTAAAVTSASTGSGW